MITQTKRNEIRKRIHSRIREKLSGTTERPRLNVYRSLDHLCADVVERAVHVQARPLGRPRKLFADARVDALANLVSLGLRNHVFSHLSAEPPRGPVRILRGFRCQVSGIS